jgi:hypothetical protein
LHSIFRASAVGVGNDLEVMGNEGEEVRTYAFLATATYCSDGREEYSEEGE